MDLTRQELVSHQEMENKNKECEEKELDAVRDVLERNTQFGDERSLCMIRSCINNQTQGVSPDFGTARVVQFVVVSRSAAHTKGTCPLPRPSRAASSLCMLLYRSPRANHAEPTTAPRGPSRNINEVGELRTVDTKNTATLSDWPLRSFQCTTPAGQGSTQRRPKSQTGVPRKCPGHGVMLTG